MPFVDNRNLIISRGVARIFPEVRKSIYYFRLSITKKWFFTAFWTLFLTDRVTLRWRNHSLRPFIANTGWGEDNAFTLYTIQLAIPRLLRKYIIQDFQATNESHRFSGKRQLVNIYFIERYARAIAYSLSREKKPDLRGWLGRVGGVTDVRRK